MESKQTKMAALCSDPELGTVSDGTLASKHSCSATLVLLARRKMGIKAFSPGKQSRKASRLATAPNQELIKSSPVVAKAVAEVTTETVGHPVGRMSARMVLAELLARGFTYKELANIAGVVPETVREWVSSRVKFVRPQVLANLRKVLSKARPIRPVIIPIESATFELKTSSKNKPKPVPTDDQLGLASPTVESGDGIAPTTAGKDGDEYYFLLTMTRYSKSRGVVGNTLQLRRTVPIPNIHTANHAFDSAESFIQDSLLKG